MTTKPKTTNEGLLDDLRNQGYTIVDGCLVVSTGASCYPTGDPKAGAGIGFHWGSGAPSSVPTSEPFPATDKFPRDNIRAELLAVIRAIELHPAPGVDLLIQSGSETAAQCVRQCELWHSYGWRKRPAGGAVANLDLMMRLHAALMAVGADKVRITYAKTKHPGKAAAKRAALRDYGRINDGL